MRKPKQKTVIKQLRTGVKVRQTLKNGVISITTENWKPKYLSF